jgi:Domain of unknown function (DUF4091)
MMWRYSLHTLLWSVWLLLLPSDTLEETAFSGPKVVAVSSLAQIRLGDPILPPTLTTLHAAKNETESFQLVVRAPQGGLSNVRVSITTFQNETGDTLSAPTLYREHYVYAHSVKRDYYKRDTYTASNVPQVAGWYADALIPFEVDNPNARFQGQPFTVAKFQNQPIWIDVDVPSEAQAGLYQSTYTVSSDQGEVTGTMMLEVWDFTLPKSISLDSSFLVWKENTKEMYVELLKHKLMPDYVESEFQAELIENWGLRLQRLGFVGGASYQDCTMNPPPSVAELQEAAQEQDQRLSLYIYPADEISDCAKLNDTMKAWSRNAHEAGVKNLVTMFPRAELLDNGAGQPAVDIWVIYAAQLMNEWDLETIKEVLSRGNEVWSYTALAGEPHAPQWAVNYSAFDFRLLPGLINLRYDMTGLLYWRVDNWSEDPWTTLQAPSDPSNYPAGEGMLLYPGEAVGINGVAPSIRLKWLRDGAEDYEYGQLLKEQGKQAVLDATVQGAVEDWYHWTKDINVLEKTREEMARAIASTQ